MRYYSILFIGIVLLGFKGVAQEFNAGIYGGAVASQIDGDTFEGYNKAGLIGGAYVNRFLNKKLAWQSGLRYTQKGSKRADSETGIFYKANLHYLELPLTLRYKYFKMLDFEAGASMGYLIKATETFDANDAQEADPAFNKIDLASIIGVNYHFNKKIAVGVFFSYSILSVRPFSSGNPILEKGQHNNLFYFTLAYKMSSWK